MASSNVRRTFIRAPKKFLLKKLPRIAVTSAERRRILEQNRKIAEANKLIDQGKLDQAVKVAGTFLTATQKKQIETFRRQRQEANKRAAERQRKIEELRRKRQMILRRKREVVTRKRESEVLRNLFKRHPDIKDRIIKEKIFGFTPAEIERLKLPVSQRQSIDKVRDFATRFAGGRIIERPRDPIEGAAFDFAQQVRKEKLNVKEAKNLRDKLIAQGRLAPIAFTDQILGALSGTKQLATATFGAALTPKQTFKAGKEIVDVVKKDPKGTVKRVTTKTGEVIKKAGIDLKDMIQTRPGEFIGRVGAEVVLLKGTATALKTLGKGKDIVDVAVSQKVKGTIQKGNKIIITRKDGRKFSFDIFGLKGKTADKVEDVLKKAGDKKPPKPTPPKPTTPKPPKPTTPRPPKPTKPSPPKPTTPKPPTKPKTVDVPDPIVLEIVKRLPRLTLREQARLAGLTVTAVSSQRQALFNLLRRRRLIRKPIPGQERLPQSVRNRLARFDAGELSTKEILKLDKDIKAAEVKIGFGGKPKGLLERAFFADPTGKIRPSRLGLTAGDESISILDIIKGNITFKRQTPQILLFDKTKVAKFPKSLEKVKEKLKRNKSLTKKEADQLLTWQLQTSGKLKPIGFATKEAELTLAPGEIIKKGRKVTSILIKGKKVDIVEAKILKPKGRTKELIKKYKKGDKSKRNKKGISKKEVKELDRRLKKETDLDYGLSRKPKDLKKYVPIKRISTSLAISVAGKARKRPRIPKRPVGRPPSRPPKRPPSRPPARPPPPTTSRPPPRPPRRPPKRPPTRPPSRPPARPPSRPPKRPPSKPPSRFKKRKVKVKKKVVKAKSYDVLAKPIKTKAGKKAKRLIKVNKVPLTKKRAEDLRNYITDTSLSRTAKIKPTAGIPKKSRLKVPSGYSRLTKEKFRTYRIVKGKRKKLSKGKVIERKRKLLDTRQERKRITLRKRIKQITKPKRKVKKVKRRSKK